MSTRRKACTDRQIYSPAAHRCVKIDGPAGKKLLTAVRKKQAARTVTRVTRAAASSKSSKPSCMHPWTQDYKDLSSYDKDCPAGQIAFRLEVRDGKFFVCCEPKTQETPLQEQMRRNQLMTTLLKNADPARYAELETALEALRQARTPAQKTAAAGRVSSALSFVRGSKKAKYLLLLAVVVGALAIYGDKIITPENFRWAEGVLRPWVQSIQGIPQTVRAYAREFFNPTRYMPYMPPALPARGNYPALKVTGITGIPTHLKQAGTSAFGGFLKAPGEFYGYHF